MAKKKTRRKATKKKASTKKSKRSPVRAAPKRSASKPVPEMDTDFEALLNLLLPRQKEFLVAFYDESTIAEAARKIGVTRQAHHDVWMAKDGKTGDYKYPLYAKLFLDAREALVGIAESALFKRGVTGIKEPIVYAGKLTGAKVTKFDTTALIFWLKGNCPEKYRERFEHTGAGGGPMRLTIDAARQIADNYDEHERKRLTK